MAKSMNLLFIFSCFLILSYLHIHVSFAIDTISGDSSLSGGRTIVSSGGVFELGFFNPGISNFYIGIWYKKISEKSIVWVANRENPVSDKSLSVLKISDGNLVLLDESQVTVWSTGLSFTRCSAVVQAVLLDDGNLVLRDGPNSSATVLWQSFDHPTDTWLPGSKIGLDRRTGKSQRLVSWNNVFDPSPGLFSLELDPDGSNSYVILLNRSKIYWTSGPWNDQLKIFEGVPEMRLNYIFNYSFVSNDNESYFTYSLYNASIMSRCVMDISGQMKQSTWLDNNGQWNVFWSQPRQQCEVYAYCGPFSVCDENSQPFCRCLPDFKPASQDLWSLLGIYSGGCIRNTELQCRNPSLDIRKNDEFLPLLDMKSAIQPEPMATTSQSMCAAACLDDCSCNAYAYDDNRCWIWTRDVLNLQQLKEDNAEGRTVYLKLVSSDILVGSSSKDKREAKDHKVRTIVLVIVPSVATVAFLATLCYCFSSRWRKARKDTESGEEIVLCIFRGQKQRSMVDEGIFGAEHGIDQQMHCISLQTILAATNGFSDDNKLGEGGFGPVYKGKLLNGLDVAIKRLSRKSSQGFTEFKNEVILIVKLQHRNLVRLLGYCVEEDKKILIYEFMSNKSLDALLFDPVKCKELDWEKRVKIIHGTTRGLQYLHEDSRLRIIHRDLKASNILLDNEMNPKISDFGTARIFGWNQMEDSMERIIGTFGYMSPEYALGGMISEKSDIYSFGVLMLEIISGKKASRFFRNGQQHSLVAYGWECWCETKGISLVDEEAMGTDSYSQTEVMRCVHVALLCVQDRVLDRPSTSQLVYMLSNNNTELPNPKQPTFTYLNALNRDPPLMSHEVSSVSGGTQTTMEGR